MLHMPFIIAFQGDPAMPFYCNDVRDCDGTPIYELIKGERNLARLKRYMAHHVTSIYAKVLIYKAGPDEDVEKAKALFWYYVYLRKPS
jgi:hypothetical protein